MSKVVWRGGRSVEDLPVALRARQKRVISDAERALEKSVEEGAVELQDILEAAVTKTGQRRQEKSGGFPGRHETGNMVGSISHNGDKPYRAGPVVTAAFGWFSGEFEDYFKDQDLGAGDIPAARGMAGAFTLARENFRRRMIQISQGRTPD